MTIKVQPFRQAMALFSAIACSILMFANAALALQNTKLALVGNKVATLIDTPTNSARANALVYAALKDYSLTITATTQAWSGSGLRNGKFQGYIDHYSLEQSKQNYLYSEPYARIPLHIASRNKKAESVIRLDKIYRQRLGIENRFANTDQLRGERSVSWARAPDFFGNIQQLAGRRVDYIIADLNMLNEFNKMLVAAKQEPLYISSAPLYEVDLQLAINSSNPIAAALISDFNAGIQKLITSQEYDNLYIPKSVAPTLLDEAIYEDIIRRW